MKNLLLFSVLFCTLSLSAQSINPSFDRRNIGLARQLTGDVHVLGVFMGNPDGLSAKDKSEYIRDLEEAERWLIREARSYGRTVRFSNYYLGRDHTIAFTPRRQWQNEQPMDVIFAAFGHNSQAAYAWLRQHPNCAVILFTDSREWCSARAAHARNSDSPKHPQMEVARIHRYEMKEKSMEIAHEMLHLFGAWDLYTTNRFHGDWREHIAALTVDCNSIMNDVWGRIDDHRVDELNAYLIGWTDEWKDWYLCFQN